MRNNKLVALGLLPLSFVFVWLLWPISKIVAVLGFIMIIIANILVYFSDKK
ncbi:hypothetical protein HMPREF1557_01423 [Streptococcus sobrinus W1703]|uniref:Uncharacterized protein n=1 Tax=Streptococcus sobrinus W1703 TaxID=1227275 RepID=U2ILM1_9STRE|nr:hypothetical protein HMPREF1557_01423 [Streptococcus sobrinus W1703]